jgi:DNA-directed RNA polymerase subunit RPC12/RpoP
MANHGTRFCDACKEREATCHVVNMVGNRRQSSDLCIECFEAREPTEQKQLRKATEAAACEYCGGRPCVYWNSLTNLFGMIVGLGQTRFLCTPCSTEYNAFLAKAFPSGAQDVSESEQLAIAEKLRERVHRHMLAWVAKRGTD